MGWNSFRKFFGIRRQVVDHPVNPGASRRVRIIGDKRERVKMWVKMGSSPLLALKETKTG